MDSIFNKKPFCESNQSIAMVLQETLVDVELERGFFCDGLGFRASLVNTYGHGKPCSLIIIKVLMSITTRL